MKILLVLEQYDGANNGNTISARRLAENLRARGHIVKVAASGTDTDEKWGFGEFHLPIFDKLITAQGFVFGRPNREKMKEAVEWYNDAFSPEQTGREALSGNECAMHRCLPCPAREYMVLCRSWQFHANHQFHILAWPYIYLQVSALYPLPEQYDCVSAEETWI